MDQSILIDELSEGEVEELEQKLAPQEMVVMLD